MYLDFYEAHFMKPSNRMAVREVWGGVHVAGS